MTRRFNHAVLILSVSLVGLAGCQNIAWLPGTPIGRNAAPESNFIPAVTPTPLDGAGAGQGLELPRQKKLEAILAAAEVMEKSGKFAEAIIYYEQIRELDPRRDLFASRKLAVLYDRKGDFDKALDEYRKLIEANPKDAAVHNDLGYGYYNRGKFEAAEKSLRKAVELDPTNKRAWANLGMTLAQIGNYPESLTAFEHAVPKAQAFCNIGFIQAAQGKFMEARDSYAMALRLEPGLQKAEAALQRLDEGPKSKRDRERLDASRRFRDDLRKSDPNLTQGLPSDGADGDLRILSPNTDEPLYLEMPPGFRSARTTAPNPFPTDAIPGAAPLPPAPNPASLSVD